MKARQRNAETGPPFLRHAASVASLTALLVTAGCGYPARDNATAQAWCAQLAHANSQTQWSRTVAEVRQLQRTPEPLGMPPTTRVGLDELVTYTLAARSREALQQRLSTMTTEEARRYELLDRYVHLTCPGTSPSDR